MLDYLVKQLPRAQVDRGSVTAAQHQISIGSTEHFFMAVALPFKIEFPMRQLQVRAAVPSSNRISETAACHLLQFYLPTTSDRLTWR